MTNYNVIQDDLDGERAITHEHIRNNQSVRDMLGQRGIMPEQLPPEEDIKKLERDGYTILPSAVDSAILDHLLLSIDQHEPLPTRIAGGIRNILYHNPIVQSLARDPVVRGVAETAVGPGALAVRGILFDKTPNANWKVVWHQDVTIAARKQQEVIGFGPWSEKDGVPHVQPPVALLADMVAVRIHLDDCTESNGPVRVIPGSHRAGRLSASEIDRWRKERPEVICTVPRGGILAFHSLLLHASSPAIEPVHRRVLHLEYVAAKWAELPGGLEWYECH